MLRRYLLLFGVVVLGTTCAGRSLSNDLDAARGRLGTLVTELSSTGPEAVPVVFEWGTYRASGSEYAVARFATPHAGSPEPIGGMSGSPVFGVDGRLLGAFSLHMFLGTDQCFGIRPPELLEESWQRARRVVNVDDFAPLHGAARPLRPGDSIAILRAWGDLNVGYCATVTEVRGDWVSVAGHGLASSGLCSYALLRAPVMGWVADGARGNKLVDYAEIVGVVAYDGANGCIGLLGRSPDTVVISVTRRDSGGETTRSYCVGRMDDGTLTSTVSVLLRDSVEDWCAHRPSDEFRIAVAGDGTTALQISGDATGVVRALVEAVVPLAGARTSTCVDVKVQAVGRGVQSVGSREEAPSERR